MTEDIRITLNEGMLEELDALIDGKKIKGRKQAAEKVLCRVLSREKVRTAFILAGGKGTRMRPFTYEMPKPLIPVQGKPLLQHILDGLRKHEIRNVIISTGYMCDKIKEYFGNGAKFGFDITYVEEEEELGTAGALRLSKDLLKDAFIMFNGDILANIDLHDLIDTHARNEGIATIALTAVEDPSRFGVAELRGEKIMRFVEKPKTHISKLINAGVYVLEPGVLEYIPKGKAMMETDVFPKLAAEGKLYGYPFEGQWFDTGTYESYESAIKNWKGVK
jgi:NDP-sugar pyrophosphorylase family protein